MEFRSRTTFGSLFFYPLLLLFGRGDGVGTIILIVRFGVAAITVGIAAIAVGGYDCRHTPMRRFVARIVDMERQHIRRECILNRDTRLCRRCTAHCIAGLLPRRNMSGLLPPYRWSLVLGDPQRSTEEISGEDGGSFAILISAFVAPGGTIFGEPGGGMESAIVAILRFLVPQVGPKNLQCALDGAYCKRLARETLANNMARNHAISDKMLVSPYRFVVDIATTK